MAEFTLAGLRVLREVATSGSFTAAGRALGYTQSAISRQIAALESVAGAPLCTRTNRGIALTETGLLLDRHGAAVLARLAAAERELEAHSLGRTLRVRLGAFPTAMAALVPRALARLPAGLTVSLREGTTSAQLRRLVAGQLDLAVVGASADRVADEYPELVAEWLLDDPLLLAVGRSHPLANVASVASDALEAERWVVGSVAASDGLLGAWEAADWAPRVAYTARDWTTKLGLVAEGLGVTIVPGLAVSAIPSAIALVRIADPLASRPVSVARPATATTTSPAQSLVTVLTQLARRF